MIFSPSLGDRRRRSYVARQLVPSTLDLAVITGKRVDFLDPSCGYSAAKMVPDFLFVITLSSVMSFSKTECG